MFEKLIEYATDRLVKQRPATVDVNGDTFAVKENGTLGEAVRRVAPIEMPVLVVSTLQGFIDAVVAKVDGFDGAAVHIVDHETVELVSLKADEFGRRHVWLRAESQEPEPFTFDSYLVPEKFLMDMQNGFLPTDNVVSLQRVVSALSNETSIATADDGFAQTVTVKQGGITRSSVDLPTRIPLLAYRTFREIDPVESPFMLRLKGVQGSLPMAGLFQLEAGKWKGDTVLQVKRWLASHLPDGTVIIA